MHSVIAPEPIFTQILRGKQAVLSFFFFFFNVYNLTVHTGVWVPPARY